MPSSPAVSWSRIDVQSRSHGLPVIAFVVALILLVIVVRVLMRVGNRVRNAGTPPA